MRDAGSIAPAVRVTVPWKTRSGCSRSVDVGGLADAHVERVRLRHVDEDAQRIDLREARRAASSPCVEPAEISDPGSTLRAVMMPSNGA